MIYTFVKGSNVPETIAVGDTHTWSQMRPCVGGPSNSRSTGPDKIISGTVVAIREDLWVDVEAERVGAPEEEVA